MQRVGYLTAHWTPMVLWIWQAKYDHVCTLPILWDCRKPSCWSSAIAEIRWSTGRCCLLLPTTEFNSPRRSGGNRRCELGRHGEGERNSRLQIRRSSHRGGWVDSSEGTLSQLRLLARGCYVIMISRAKGAYGCRKRSRL